MQDYSRILSARGWASPVPLTPAQPPAESTTEAEQIPPDPYEARLRAVLLQTCRPEYPAGMVPWLETANPSLYDDLTSRLPDLIHRLWTAHAPLEEFQHVVDAWLGAHRRACERYKR